jgi:Tfp pilus assembly protein PilO
MFRSFKRLAGKNQGPAHWVRLILGSLLVMNLIGAALVVYPPGGSEEALTTDLARLQSDVLQKKALVERTRTHAASVEKGRQEGERFLNEYFLARRTAYAALLEELTSAAERSGIRAREHTWDTELIEGSDSLSMMTITANYEGTYRDLMNFVEEIDRSSRLFIIESLTAAPQTGGNTLSVNLKLDTFVKDEPPAASGEVIPTGQIASVGGFPVR